MAARRQRSRLSEPDLHAARELHDDALQHVKGVDALLSAGDHSGTVLLAYELCRETALGLLLASGWRPAGGEGEHRITFEAAGQLLAGPAAHARSDAVYLRRQRNDNMYRQERADTAAAEEAADLPHGVVDTALPALARLQ